MSEHPAPAVSADFQTGNVHTGLERIRTRLLDLTNRNRLLNFRYSKSSSLRLVGVNIDSLFERIRNNEKLSICPVSEPDLNRGEELPLAKDYAEKLKWNTSFDLEENEIDDSFQNPRVLHYHEELDIKSRKIAAAAKTAIEESGTNMLYLIFGFLEWYESDDSEQSHLAPLIVVPITLERTGGKGKAIETQIEYSGEDVESNLSLVEKLRRDFGLEAPLFEEDDTPGSYFAKFQSILELKKRWAIKQHLSVALLSFGKLLMYRDLDPKTWPKERSIATHTLVRNLFEGSKSTEATRAEEFDIDSLELKKDIPFLIRDADSSQHSALVHAFRGQNLVLEGPPGTGKSQTITNLIAAALAKGKTVLFVAEKLAALEVVRRRLDDAGLGIFCLEVHSHKTKKGALLADVASRLQKKGTFKDPRNIDQHISIVEDRKKLLSKYAAAINRTIQPFNSTVFEILWARERYGQEIGILRDRLSQIALPSAKDYGSEQFAETEQFLGVYAEHLGNILNGQSFSEHPWSWVNQVLSFSDEERIVTLLQDFITCSEAADLCCKHLAETAGIDFAGGITDFSKASALSDALPQAGPQSVSGRILVHCQSRENRIIISEFVRTVERYRASVSVLSAASDDPSALLKVDLAKSLSEAVANTRHWAVDARSLTEIRNLRNLGIKARDSIRNVQSATLKLLELLQHNAPITSETATHLLATAAAINGLPFQILSLRHTAFEKEETKQILEGARKDAKTIKLNEATLGRDFDLSLKNGAITNNQLKWAASIIDNAGIISRLCGKDYKQAVGIYRELSVAKGKVHRTDMSKALRSIADHAEMRKRFEELTVYKDTFGKLFSGIDTRWGALEQTQAWYDHVLRLLPAQVPTTEAFRRLIFDSKIEQLKAIKANLATFSPADVAALKGAISTLTEFESSFPGDQVFVASASLEEVAKNVERFVVEVSTLLDICGRAAVADRVLLGELSGLTVASNVCRDAISSIQASSTVASLLQGDFSGPDTNTDVVKGTVAFADTIVSLPLPDKGKEWLLSEHHTARRTDLQVSLEALSRCGIELDRLAGEISEISKAPVWNGNGTHSLVELQSIARNSGHNQERLSSWNHYLRLRARSDEMGLNRVAAVAEDGLINPRQLVPAFRYCFYNTLARSVFSEDTELSQFAGVTQELLQQQFAKADKESIRLYSERVAAQIDVRSIPNGNQTGPVRTWTELALLINEINKQKRHLPIRQLLLRACNALVALKPCFMMGPLSVAQYLAPGKLTFDLVVMDEASQLKPEDAIGALARGGQVVIVGDPKQLPPTSFFQRVANDGDDDDIEELRTAIEEGESILDVASTLFQPVRRLRWHYRSRHHSLIAFSNQEFYQGDLIIFPSAYHDSPSLGVKYCFVQNGVFEQSRNAPEAGVVVEAVLQHMREHPNESLGVVTLNFEQRELVEELLDKRMREDPAALAFQEHMNGGQDSIFVKNLENVQGDERDVIFISTTYGPDARGNQFQRFGPLNGPSGHRRLNVLFTRAKSRTVVFSSLDPERIQTTSNSPWGLRALKQYLIYAKTGILQQAEGGTDQQEINDFERSVSSVLRDNGYEVVPQVGVAGFFIDIGVKHPAKPGAFLLGIEADGAGYHSGRSARDRDRLRQEILANLGWKIHRVWSTDWFRSRETEIRRLLQNIKSLLDRDSAYQHEREQARTRESLKQQLEALRDNEIAPRFPNTPLELSLLNDALLHQFVQKRPKSKEEWIRTTPYEIRSIIDSRQVKEYLERILSIIAKSEGD